MRYIIYFLSVILFQVATPSFAGSSTVNRSDGGKTTVTTTGGGSMITVFSSKNQVICTRTVGETNHAKAISKYRNIKCMKESFTAGNCNC